MMKDLIQELKETAIKRAEKYISDQYERWENIQVDKEIDFLDDYKRQIGYIKIKGSVYELVPAQNNSPFYPDDPAEIEVELHEIEVKLMNSSGEMHINLTNAINKTF